jgi:hypothetical protein
MRPVLQSGIKVYVAPRSGQCMTQCNNYAFKNLMLQTAVCIIQACRDLPLDGKPRGLMDILFKKSRNSPALLTPLRVQVELLYAFVQTEVEAGRPFYGDDAREKYEEMDMELIAEALLTFENYERRSLTLLAKEFRGGIEACLYPWSDLNHQFLNLNQP